MAIDPEAETARWLATLSPEETARAVSYTQGGYWMILWGLLVAVVVGWIIVRTNLLGRIRDGLERKKARPNLTVLLTALVYSVLQFLLTLPWSVYANWYREKHYGLTGQSLGGWLEEAAMAAGISAVLMTVLFLGLYALMRRAPRTWWMWGAGMTAVGMAVVLVAAPIFIEPLFNTYTPAPDGPVRDAVVELAEQTGTPSDKIYIYDGSRQSDRYTANVSGLFGTARVAMSDVMFAQGADLAEVRGVVGHEMGHYVHMHILISLVVLVVLAAIAFWLTDRLFPLFRRWMGASAVGGISDPVGLPVLGVVLAVIIVLATPLLNTLTRLQESDADRFSLEHAREPDGLARALIKTAEYRAPSPSAVEEFLFYSHPSVERRIHRAMVWKAEHGGRRGGS